MRISGSLRAGAVAVAGIALLAGCGGTDSGRGEGRHDAGGHRAGASPVANLKRIPGLGERLRSRIPAEAGQVVAVYGRGRNSADATVVLWTKNGGSWDRTRSWTGHNGKRGWTTDHRQDDKRSPVGVFTLTDAGGVLPDPGPGKGLPYSRSAAFAAPRSWAESHWHDFDYVIAIDYNRVKGTAPNDPTRPEGQAKGGSIWLHMDHGSGTSGCVSLSKSGMAYLLRTLDPARHPVVVMGDRAHLTG
ncbi:L,D-transpeptidase family protein [Streptomyces sp. NPDC048639]|uniref:L,D-transpeptidase family protein n=1 Tax=Streptomyces sp. NPDC048639 TaxID=3365581 RepID=UPI00371A0160